MSGVSRIAIDLEKLRHINTGLGRFSLHLGTELIRMSPGEFDPVFFMSEQSSHYFHESGFDLIRTNVWKKESLQRFFRPILQPFLPKSEIALWHTTHQLAKYLPLDSSIPILLTIHDLNFLQDDQGEVTTPPLSFRQKRKLAAVQKLVDRASALTTVSRFTEGVVRKNLSIKGKSIYVIPNGMARPGSASPRRPAFLSPGEYYLTVGNCLRHKNFHVLIRMIAEIPQARLVIAGKKQTPYGVQLQKEIIRLGLETRVLMTGEVSHGDLQWLYENCQAFFFPSLAEGFGFPVLEAMQCGKPVFMARSTSLPEIAGKYGFFFDSFEPQNMANTCCEGLKTFRMHSMKEQCQEHARSFSWERTVKAYIAVYKSILGLPL